MIVVSRPAGSDRGLLSVDMMTTFARARQQKARACLLRPPIVCDEALFALTADDVTVVRPRGVAGVPALVRWWVSAAADLTSARVRGGAASFWRELHIELRRHAGDDRLPSTLRGAIRRMAHDAFTRSAAGGTRQQFPRRLLREPVRTRLPRELQAEAERTAASVGIAAGSRLVALEVRSRLEPFADAIDFLVAHGYTVVRIGDRVAGPVRRPGIVDLAHSAVRTPLVEVFVMLESAFLVCEDPALQTAAYLTNTPCLLVNAIDPIASYPVRADGLYAVTTPVHLDTGERLAPGDLLKEDYFRNRRNYGFRKMSSADILDAVREMHEGLHNGWSESPAQSQFRVRVTESAAAPAAPTHRPGGWGADDGFMGDGRLARVQAERAL